MTFSQLPAFLATCFTRLATALDARSALRLPLLLTGMLCAGGRRTCTAWFRAADIGDDFRNAYTVVWACGRQAKSIAARLLPTVDPLLTGPRLLLAIDDTPTARYGPCIEGAGLHHNSTALLLRSGTTEVIAYQHFLPSPLYSGERGWG